MNLNVKRFYQACNPSKKIDLLNEESFYIDFSNVRGSDVVGQLMRSIILAEKQSTCQLFTGHIGCGKSTELSRLKQKLEIEGYHVVYFESTDDLDIGDVDISDILLAIAKRVSQSLEESEISIYPNRFSSLLTNTINLLNADITGLNLNIPGVDNVGMIVDEDIFSLSFGIGCITAKTKDSQNVRDLLRQHLDPQVTTIIEIINEELINVANRQLMQKGKEGLAVIVDNLDRIKQKSYEKERTRSKYLFIDRADQLNKLNCHVVYTIPLMLSFCDEREEMINRFGVTPQVLPMVRVKNKDNSLCETGLESLRKMVLARAFPSIDENMRLLLLDQVFDCRDTLDSLCVVSGGHVRNLLVLLSQCLRSVDPPLTKELLEEIIEVRWNELNTIIDSEEWPILQQIYRTKEIEGTDECRALLRSLLVFQYRNKKGKNWFDLNPLLLNSSEIREEENSDV